MAYCNWVTAVSRYTSAFLRSEIPGPWDYHFKSKDFGVFSRETSALAHRRRGPALLEDRGEGLVPAQRH